MGSHGIEERLLQSSSPIQLLGEDSLKVRVCEESRKIWRIALPGIISRITSFGTLVGTQSFIGHINSTDLAGYALVQTLLVRFVEGILGIWIGMLIGIICQTVALTFVMWRINWNEEVVKTSMRLKKWYVKSPDQAMEGSDDKP